MKKLIILIFAASLLFGVKPVPREKKQDNSKSKVKIEETVKPEINTQRVKEDNDQKRKDYFKDADSNGVNDQREDDLQKIIKLKTKHKDLLKKISDNKDDKKSQKTRKEKTKEKSK